MEEYYFPDFHVVLIDYLEELGNTHMLLEIMPTVSYELSDLYNYFIAGISYEEFYDIIYPVLVKLLEKFSEEVYKRYRDLNIGTKEEIFDEVHRRVMNEVRNWFRTRGYEFH